jgi:hypothetical protein
MTATGRRVDARAIALATFEVLGAVLFLMAVRKLVYALHVPLAKYDEGILLTDSMLVSMGQVPYRDFYTNYGPGIFWVLAGIWKVFGVSVLPERVLGCLVQPAVAIACGLLVGRATGRRFSLLGAGLVAAWLSTWLSPYQPPIPYAWLVALTLIVAALWALSIALEGDRMRPWLGAGAALGLASWFRPELVATLALVLFLVGVVWLRIDPSLPSPARRRGAGAFVLAAVAAALPAWGTVFALAGTQPIYDLFIDQTRIRAARVLPFPPLLPLTAQDDLPWPLPAFLVDSHPGAIVLCLAAPVVGLLLAAFGSPLGLARRSVLLTAALAVAVLPQMMGRSDQIHCVYTVPPALVLGAALLESPAIATPAALLAATLGVVALFLPCRDLQPLPPTPAFATRAFPRYGGIPDNDANRLHLVEMLQAQTTPGEPIFVGLSDHRRTQMNDLELYFLTGHPGGTRYLQFDPNLTNREDVQVTIIRDLEARGVRWVVLGLWPANEREPNESTRMGSDALDVFLRRTFRPFARMGNYLILRRTSG